MEKNSKPQPVVRLRSSSEDEGSDSDNDNVDEEKEKELRMLRLLKSGLAAKAKEALEKKLPKKSKTPEIPNILKRLKDRSGSPKLPEKSKIEPDVFDIKVLSMKKDNEEKKVAEDTTKASTEERKIEVEAKLKSLRRSRSPSSSRSRSRSRSGDRSRSSSKSSYR